MSFCKCKMTLLTRNIAHAKFKCGGNIGHILQNFKCAFRYYPKIERPHTSEPQTSGTALKKSVYLSVLTICRKF